MNTSIFASVTEYLRSFDLLEKISTLIWHQTHWSGMVWITDVPSRILNQHLWYQSSEKKTSQIMAVHKKVVRSFISTDCSKTTSKKEKVKMSVGFIVIVH